MSHATRTAACIAALLLVPACTNDPTVGPAKGYFNLIDPANGAIGINATPTFDWEDSFSVDTPTYTIQVATDPGLSSLVVNQSGLTTTSFTPGSALSAGTLYYWQVLAVHNTGTVVSTGAPWSFTTFSATPAPFTMLAPANPSTVVPLMPTFTWNASTGAASYTLEVATDSGFAGVVINQSGLTMQSFTPTTPLNLNTTYWWKVIAVSTNSTTATGAPWTFTTEATSITLTAPASGAMGVSTTPSYNWNITGTTPASYTLQVATDSGFTSIVVNQSGITTPPVMPSGTLTTSTTYFWKVQAFDGSNSLLGTSSVFSFKT